MDDSQNLRATARIALRDVLSLCSKLCNARWEPNETWGQRGCLFPKRVKRRQLQRDCSSRGAHNLL